MESYPSKNWSLKELYDLYLESDGQHCQRCLADIIRDDFKDIIVKIGGGRWTQSKYILWAHLPEQLKKNNDDSLAEVKQLCEKIKAEIFDIELQRRSKFEYNLNEFQYEKVMADTSRTLFTVLKYLTNNEKQAVCLAQAIQQHVSKTWNQTSLGLALMLHYKNGSREMIDQLARCQFISSYHEVIELCDFFRDHMIKNG